MKSLIRKILINIFNRANSNNISTKSLCSHKLSYKFKNVTIKDNSLVDTNSAVGNHCYMGYGVFVSSATIGRYCSIGNYVSIGPGEHSLSFASTHSYFMAREGVNLTDEAVTLGPDVWVGVGAIILRGVKIGTGAVVGAGAVVTKDVPPYAIVVGVPAKVVRYRFSQNKIEKLLESEWWNDEPNVALKRLRYFEEVY